MIKGPSDMEKGPAMPGRDARASLFKGCELVEFQTLGCAETTSS